VYRGQFDVLVGPHVAGHEELTVGHEVGVVGDGEGGIGVVGVQVDAGKVGLVVEGQQVVGGADLAVGAGTGLEQAAGVGPQRVGHGDVGAVDHGSVQPGGDVVGLLRGRGDAGARVELGTA